MSARLISMNDAKAFGIQLKPVAAVLRSDIGFFHRNFLEQIVGDTLLAAAVRQIRNSNFIGHGNSLRGCLAPATIAEAGGVASLSGGSVL